MCMCACVCLTLVSWTLHCYMSDQCVIRPDLLLIHEVERDRRRNREERCVHALVEWKLSLIRIFLQSFFNLKTRREEKTKPLLFSYCVYTNHFYFFYIYVSVLWCAIISCHRILVPIKWNKGKRSQWKWISLHWCMCDVSAHGYVCIVSLDTLGEYIERIRKKNANLYWI